jgi:hypothetical protein
MIVLAQFEKVWKSLINLFCSCFTLFKKVQITYHNGKMPNLQILKPDSFQLPFRTNHGFLAMQQKKGSTFHAALIFLISKLLTTG